MGNSIYIKTHWPLYICHSNRKLLTFHTAQTRHSGNIPKTILFISRSLLNQFICSSQLIHLPLLHFLSELLKDSTRCQVSFSYKNPLVYRPRIVNNSNDDSDDSDDNDATTDRPPLGDRVRCPACQPGLGRVGVVQSAGRPLALPRLVQGRHRQHPHHPATAQREGEQTIVLCCTVLYCAVLYCTVLFCTVHYLYWSRYWSLSSLSWLRGRARLTAAL